LETFTALRELIFNPGFNEQRSAALKEINFDELDAPITDLIKKIASIEYCFPLQSCYGHFLCAGQNYFRNIMPLPAAGKITRVNYRIAYIALCIKQSTDGTVLLEDLNKIAGAEPDYIQFGCAGWFWERQVNSYTLQVEPKRFMDKDKIEIDYDEAFYIEKIRNMFFVKLNEATDKHLH